MTKENQETTSKKISSIRSQPVMRMSPRGDRRIAIPVPVQPKPSLWKTIRHKIRQPLRRFNNIPDSGKSKEAEVTPSLRRTDSNECSPGSFHKQRRLGNDAAPDQEQFETRPLGSKVEKDARQEIDTHGNQQATLPQVVSDPEVTRRALLSEYTAPPSPYYDGIRYESSYITPRTDIRTQQGWPQYWDASSQTYPTTFQTQPHATPYHEYQGTNPYYQHPIPEYYENRHFQQDRKGVYYGYTDENPHCKTNNHERIKRKIKGNKAREPSKTCNDPFLSPKMACGAAQEVFSADSITAESREDSDISASWAGMTTEEGKRKTRGPTTGVLEATILQNFTDNTMDASALEAETHNAVFELSNTVRKGLRHSAEEVGAVFIHATDAFLLGNRKSRKGHRRVGSGGEESSIGYERYFDKYTGRDSAQEDGGTEGITDAEDETMDSSVASFKLDYSSSEEIEMTWPQWQNLTYGALSFGKHKKR